jgi:mannose-6-phosphate isomerase-like protein (cupin superfamily)
MREDLPGVRSRVLNGPGSSAWDGPVLSEWELRGAGWEDTHPHTELNVVLEGRLYVKSGGVEVVLEEGDWVEVPAGVTGRYWAPEHARMLAVYGPNPQGEPTAPGSGWVIEPC